MSVRRSVLIASGVLLATILITAAVEPASAERWWQSEITRFRVTPLIALFREARQAGDWQRGQDLARRILVIDPERTDVRLEALDMLYENRRYDEALAAAERITSPDAAGFAHARYIRALILYETDRMAIADAALHLAAFDPALASDLRARARGLVAQMEAARFPVLAREEMPVTAAPLPTKEPVPDATPLAYPRPEPPAVPLPPEPPAPAAQDLQPSAMARAYEALDLGDAPAALLALDAAAEDGQGPIVDLYRGYAYMMLRRPDDAEAAFRKAAASDLDEAMRSGAWAQTGYLALAREDRSAAIHAFRQALSLAPPSRELLLQLGYVLAAEMRWRDAVATLERAEALDGGSPQLYQDIGYAARNAGEPKRAARWFKRALDHPAALPRDRQLALKQEVEWLEDRFDISLYSAFRGNAVDAGTLNPLERSVLQSQGGLAMRYIPPGLGGEVDRFLAVTGRLLWSYDKDSLSIPSASWQGGVGLGLKPLAQENFVLGAERLIAIGRDARDDWLVRAGYSWSHVAQDSPGPDARLYLDAALIDPSSPDILTSGDIQIGKLLEIESWLRLWPHLLLAGNWQDDDYGSVSLVEAGPGLTATFDFDEGRYRAYRASLDISLQYRIKLAGSSVGQSGPLLTLSLRR